MTGNRPLRPLERRVLRMVEDGLETAEIALRFRRRPDTIHRIVRMAALPGRATVASAGSDVLRPLERRVLRWRDGGAGYDEIGVRFRRSAAGVERVERLAHYKLSRL